MIDRRRWIRLASGGVVGLAAPAPGGFSPRPQKNAGDESEGSPDSDLEAVRARLQAARIGPLRAVRSAHYQAIGDLAEAFMNVILGDCEQLAEDYLAHFRARGFEVRLPVRRLTVVLFRESRDFHRFLTLPSPAPPADDPGGLRPAGAYDRKTNVLHVFDWRNVPMAPRSAHRNIETIAHEGTHQLTFNTGLLHREGDVPLCVVEGLGTYGEARRPLGPGGFGRLNLRRLEDLAKIQRQTSWIPLRELLADDGILREGSSLRVLLGYAQSWLLIHYFMKTPAELPRWRGYLATIAGRASQDHRLKDATAHLGDLDALDRTLRRYSVRLLMS